MHKGTLILVLHCHLPWVRHPEHERSAEEAWLFEAMYESYIPLLDMLDALRADGIPCPLTLSVSPTLLAMLKDTLLQERFEAYMERHVELCGAEVRRLAADPDFGPLARLYSSGAADILESFRGRHNRRLAESLTRLSETGGIELITTSATHAYLPNLVPFPQTVTDQIRGGLHAMKRITGRRPRGFWLPECGYYDGLDAFLGREHMEYFFSEGHALLHAVPRPPHGVYRPVRTPGGPVAFARDASTVQKVWNSTHGYPGSPEYRDFHRDAGFELPHNYIAPYLHPAGIRGFTGLKYWSITGTSPIKAPYRPSEARSRAREHAADFIGHLESLSQSVHSKYGFAPCVVAPFDAELFGHWWFEGTWWLEDVIRGLARSTVVSVATPSQYLEKAPAMHRAAPSPSSWGSGGYGRTWASGENTIWLERILAATARMEALEASLGTLTGPRRTAMAQARAEVLLAQASDWPFMLHNGTFPDYARKRLDGHLLAADTLMRMAADGNVDVSFINTHRFRLPKFLIQ